MKQYDRPQQDSPSCAVRAQTTSRPDGLLVTRGRQNTPENRLNGQLEKVIGRLERQLADALIDNAALRIAAAGK